MKEILIFAGTTEGRKLAECLAEAGISHTVCVATEYGQIVLTDHPLTKVHQGRMDSGEIREFLRKGEFEAVVDATHPYAEQITRNIKEAAGEIERMEGRKIPCLRLRRAYEKRIGADVRRIVFFGTDEECAEALKNEEGNILLTTGSRELSRYCVSECVRDRLYVRVLPSAESLSLCAEQGIRGKRVIAMQGPFTADMNAALIRQYGISLLVTKESGKAGGYREKLEAAEQTGCDVFVVGRPEETEGFSFSGICRELERILGQPVPAGRPFEIILAGAGMGDRGSLTGEVREALEGADILLGAERLLEPYRPGFEKRPFYQAGQIIPYLRKMQEEGMLAEDGKAVILFSGDSGFYSGCRPVREALEKEIREGRLSARLRIMPGISSVSYLASRVGESYQDAAVYSMHGREAGNLVRRIKSSPKTFLLMSGVEDVNRLGNLLTEAGMTECEVAVGRQLSYGEQTIRWLSPETCGSLTGEGLYTCLVKNPAAEARSLTPVMKDEAFIRDIPDKVPMTKAEVRAVSICRLHLHSCSVVYDIGSGTGSVAVEIAGLSDEIQVYAVERKREAVSLIKRNRDRLFLQNLAVVEAEAPEGLEGLPAATHAFIGGSGGKMKEILAVLHRINPGMRVVINAVSMETICEIKEILASYRIRDEETVQLQVSRIRKAGGYHLMQAENPVWICAFEFAGK